VPTVERGLWEVDFWSSIGTERFNIPALPCREDSVKGKGRFAGTRDASEDNQAIARQFQVNILQVVLPSSANAKLNERVALV